MGIRKWLKKNTAEDINRSREEDGDNVGHAAAGTVDVTLASVNVSAITVVEASTCNASSILPDSLPLPAPPSLPDKQPSASTLPPVGGPQVPGDLGSTQPTQVFLKTYPTRLYSGVKRSFCSSWFAAREWLEYSCEKDSIFCYACRNFGSNKNSTDAFTMTGYNNWRHALVRGKGLGRHESSKEHMKSVALWKERRTRSVTGTEISTLVNTAQLERNRTYVAAIVDIIQFIALNQLPFRGSDDALDARGEVGSGIFLALMDYTLKKDKDLARIFSTIPANATYTSHHIQNEIIEIMSTIITEEIVKDIGEAWYTLKVDGTKDPTGCENISIVLRYVDTSNTVRERLVSMATTKQCDAKSLTQLVLAQLRDIGLNTAKVLSQCYDGASVMSGVHGGMQKIVQEELQREVPYVHCFNHQLHLVVVHAMSSDFALENFFSVCTSLYKYFKKPTVAAVYTGEKLKRLLSNGGQATWPQ